MSNNFLWQLGSGFRPRYKNENEMSLRFSILFITNKYFIHTKQTQKNVLKEYICATWLNEIQIDSRSFGSVGMASGTGCVIRIDPTILFDLIKVGEFEHVTHSHSFLCHQISPPPLHEHELVVGGEDWIDEMRCFLL